METMQLAPAAGAGLGKLVAAELLAIPDLPKEMALVIHRAMRATTRRWDPGAKDWIIDDDMRSQLQAFALTLAHMEGEPVKRIIHQHLGGDGQIDLGAALRDSPALQAAIERQLENARFKDRKRGGKTPPKAAEVVIDE